MCQREFQLFYCGGFDALDVRQTPIANCAALNNLRWEQAPSMPQSLRGNARATVRGEGFTCGGENQVSTVNARLDEKFSTQCKQNEETQMFINIVPNIFWWKESLGI